MDFTTSLLTEFPSRRILSRDATRNAAALAMNDSRHRTAKPGLIFGIELREFFFADVFDVLFHVFWVRWLSRIARVDSEKASEHPSAQLDRVFGPSSKFDAVVGQENAAVHMGYRGVLHIRQRVGSKAGWRRKYT